MLKSRGGSSGEEEEDENRPLNISFRDNRKLSKFNSINNINNNNSLKNMRSCRINSLNVKKTYSSSCSSSSSPSLSTSTNSQNNRCYKKPSFLPMLPSYSLLLFTQLILLLLCSSWTMGAEEDCPWYGNPRVSTTIKSNCLCARNRTSFNQLSVQCHEIDGQALVNILLANRAGLKDHPLELLYLNGSHVTDSNGQMPARFFRELKLVSLQLSGCGIKSIHPDALRGQESHLKHISLAQNQLSEVPVASLEGLTQVVLLDLSYNKITKIPENAFETLTKLSTLKLNDNNLELDSYCFRGLENSLRNLNLKGTRINIIPEAIANLSSLAFLDLAQNRLRDLEPLPFVRLHSLTVLNLERNLLQSLPESVFTGVNDTLSSLSLLNNLITHFPKEALHSLKELRVLDLGFNLLTEIPTDAFSGLSSLTLLALDGNPLASLPLKSFAPINSTLRGLSLGGRFLNCDCRIKWVSDWIHEYDLQVTSRERNPQFCGSPPALRQYNFYQIQADDLKCDKLETTSPSSSSTTTEYDTSPEEDVTLLGVNSKPFIQTGESAENTNPNPNTNFRKTTRHRIQRLKPKLKLRVNNNNNNNNVPPRQQQSTPTDAPIINNNNNNKNKVSQDQEQGKPVSDEDNDNKERVPLTASGSSFESGEYDSEQTNDNSQEIHDTASSNSEPVEKPALVSSSPRTIVSSTTTQSPSSLTTTKKVQSLSVIKPFPGLRPKLQIPPPKVITSTTTSTSVTSTSTSSTTSKENADSLNNNNTPDNFPSIQTSRTRNNVARPPTGPQSIATTTTSKPNTITIQRFVPSDSIQIRKPAVSFDDPNFDDSNIPVITGVGPVRTISGSGTLNPNSNSNNNNAGSIISVKSNQQQNIQTHHSSNNNPLSPQTSPSLSSSSSSSSNSIISNNRPPNLIFAEKSEIILKDIERQSDMVLLHWDSQKHVSGFRIIYRIFGEDTFRHGPPLASTEREYRIKNIPTNECIVVCVVPYEDILYNEISPSPGSVPPGSQCRELKPTSPSALMSNMDKITIGASAAICATVLLAVFIFIIITRRSKNRRNTSGLISKVPPGSMIAPSPGPQNMINPGSLSLIKEWDQLSAISARSIPRARVYHGNSVMENGGAMGNGHGTNRSVVLPVQQQQQQQQQHHQSQRSVADGHSTHRSYLSSHHAHHNHSIHGYGHHSNGHISTHSSTSAAVNSYLNNQSRLLRASLGSRSSQDALNKQLGPSAHVHRHFEQNQKRRRPGVLQGRLSQSDSLNTLSGYETPDNWTDRMNDHDMDVYVARNATRHDLVQL